MAKKKSKLNLGKILSFAAALLAIVALALMFAPALGVKSSDKAYTGWQVAFGYSEKAEILGSTVSTKVLLFSAYFIPYALLVGGLAFSVLAGLGILPKFSKFIAAGCYACCFSLRCRWLCLTPVELKAMPKICFLKNSERRLRFPSAQLCRA